MIDNNNLSNYMAHISSLGLLMAPYIILSMVIGTVHSCTISNPQLFAASNLSYNNDLPCTHLHLSEVKHVTFIALPNIRTQH